MGGWPWQMADGGGGDGEKVEVKSRQRKIL